MAYPSERLNQGTPEDKTPAQPENVAPASQTEQDDWAEFQAYKAWKSRQSAQPEPESEPEDEVPAPSPVLNPDEHQADISVEKGELETAIRSGQLPPGALERLLKRLDDVEGELARYRAGQSSDATGPDGGAPVPHHLHLVDGTVITNHPGLATHVAHEDGRIVRVLHAFRADEDINRP